MPIGRTSHARAIDDPRTIRRPDRVAIVVRAISHASQASAIGGDGVDLEVAAELDIAAGASATLRVRLTDSMSSSGVAGHEFDEVFAQRIAGAVVFRQMGKSPAICRNTNRERLRRCAGSWEQSRSIGPSTLNPNRYRTCRDCGWLRLSWAPTASVKARRRTLEIGSDRFSWHRLRVPR